MRDPAIDLFIRAINNKEPYEKLSTMINTILLPYIDEITRDKRLQDLFDNISRCKKCGLCAEFGTKYIPIGNTYAEIMIVGESITEQSEELLYKMLDNAAKNIDIRFLKSNLYFSNIVKAKPASLDKKRDITEAERIACNHFIMEEIELIKPKVILCIGSIAAQILISPSFEMLSQQNSWFGDSTKKITMYHPEYILHLNEGSPEQIVAKQKCWKVLQSINTYLSSISEEPVLS